MHNGSNGKAVGEMCKVLIIDVRRGNGHKDSQGDRKPQAAGVAERGLECRRGLGPHLEVAAYGGGQGSLRAAEHVKAPGGLEGRNRDEHRVSRREHLHHFVDVGSS